TDSPEAEWYYRNFQVELFYKHPADYMACISTAIAGGSGNRLGHFPTPQPVVECMIQMLMHDRTGDRKTASVCDPCMGTGIMLLNASNYSLNLFGTDISLDMVKMALLNMFIFCPWAAWGATFHDDGTLTPCVKIAHGNSLEILPRES